MENKETSLNSTEKKSKVIDLGINHLITDFFFQSYLVGLFDGAKLP